MPRVGSSTAACGCCSRPTAAMYLLLVAAGQPTHLAPRHGCRSGALTRALSTDRRSRAEVDRAPPERLRAVMEARCSRAPSVASGAPLHGQRGQTRARTDGVRWMRERLAAPFASSSPSLGRLEPLRMSKSSSWPWPSSATTPSTLARGTARTRHPAAWYPSSQRRTDARDRVAARWPDISWPAASGPSSPSAEHGPRQRAPRTLDHIDEHRRSCLSRTWLPGRDTSDSIIRWR